MPDDVGGNIQQPFLAAALSDALGEAGLIQSQMLIAFNFGLVATVNQKTVIKAPDWLYVPAVVPVAETVVRRSYTPTLEGEPVAVVAEFLSETDTGEYSVRPTYPYGKLYFYEHILQVPTYIIFDPHSLTLEVRQLENEQYVLQSPDAAGRFWIPSLNLFIGTWYGSRLGSTLHWLRWWDDSGNLLLWSFEKAALERQRAEQEKARADAAEQEIQRLRSLLNDRENPA